MLQSNGPGMTPVKPLLEECVLEKKGNYIIHEDMALLLRSYWCLREFDRKSTVATLLLHGAEPRECCFMFIHWTRKFTKSDSYLRIILCIRRTKAMRLHSGLSKSLGQDRYLDDIIHTFTAWRGASQSQREKDCGAQWEKALGQRKRQRKRCIWPEAFASLIPFLLPWVSDLEEPHLKIDSWGVEKAPQPSLRGIY